MNHEQYTSGFRHFEEGEFLTGWEDPDFISGYMDALNDYQIP